MGASVLNIISFKCEHHYPEVAGLAAKHLPLLQEAYKEGWEYRGPHRDAAQFLSDVAEQRINVTNGSYVGSPLIWSTSAQNTTGDELIEALAPFFKDLLKGDLDDGPWCGGHILLFSEYEDAPMNVYEICLNGMGLLSDPDPNIELVIKQHQAPYRFNS